MKRIQIIDRRRRTHGEHLWMGLLGYALAGLGIAAFLSGCGTAAGPSKGHVTGTVTLDGQALEKGTILFSSADHTAPNAAATIQHGVYSAEVYAGKMEVQISALQVVGQRKLYDTADSPSRDITEERLPARYNSQSTLTADIKSGEQKLDFPLQSK
jgi:hypothetical protein